MRQRVMIAVALAGQSESADRGRADHRARRDREAQILDIILGLQKKLGTAVILISKTTGSAPWQGQGASPTAGARGGGLAGRPPRRGTGRQQGQPRQGARTPRSRPGRSLAPGARREALDAMAAILAGQSTTVDSVAAGLRWRTPRLFGRLREDLLGWTMRRR